MGINVTNKPVFARVKIPGLRDALLFNDGEYGIARLMSEILKQMSSGPYQSRNGQMIITLQFDGPIKDDTTQEDRDAIEAENKLRALCVPMEEIRSNQSDDMNMLTDIVTGETDMSPEDLELFREYRRMFSEKYRMSKSGDFIRQVKTEAESKFAHIKSVICCNLGGQDWWQV